MSGTTSPALPWEVIERVIDHSAGHTRTLRCLALTCRDLHPRSAIQLFRPVQLRHRDEIFDLCDVLRAKPYLQPCVRSIWMPIDEFSPHPLLRMLPNLSGIELDHAEAPEKTPSNGLLLHSSVLRCCYQLGQHIQSLSIWYITFRSLSDFSAILLSFPKIQSLSCRNVEIKSDDRGGRAREESIARLSERLKLKLNLRTLSVSTPRGHLFL
ncbi:hypothetical protein V8D89_003954 [Ganoderma adspersum]